MSWSFNDDFMVTQTYAISSSTTVVDGVRMFKDSCLKSASTCTVRRCNSLCGKIIHQQAVPHLWQRVPGMTQVSRPDFRQFGHRTPGIPFCSVSYTQRSPSMMQHTGFIRTGCSSFLKWSSSGSDLSQVSAPWLRSDIGFEKTILVGTDEKCHEITKLDDECC